MVIQHLLIRDLSQPVPIRGRPGQGGGARIGDCLNPGKPGFSAAEGVGHYHERGQDVQGAS